jgi:hypothetical protein
LAKVLYLWDGLRPPLPRSLEYYLSCTFHELIGDVYVWPREWQLLSNKEEHLAKTLALKESSQKDDRRSSILSKSTDDEFDKHSTQEQLTGRDSESRQSKTKGKMLSRTNTLADISESDEGLRRDLSRPVSRQKTETFSRSQSKKDLSNKDFSKPKTRVEKYKSGMNLDSKVSNGNVLLYYCVHKVWVNRV